jgi:hypothetical protein
LQRDSATRSDEMAQHYLATRSGAPGRRGPHPRAGQQHQKYRQPASEQPRAPAHHGPEAHGKSNAHGFTSGAAS